MIMGGHISRCGEIKVARSLPLAGFTLAVAGGVQRLRDKWLLSISRE